MQELSFFALVPSKLVQRPLENSWRKSLLCNFQFVSLGKVVNAKIGGGPKISWYMRDSNYPEVGERDEKVLRVHPDPVRTAHLALVGSGNHKRYIIAHQNVKEGDVITTSCQIPPIPGNEEGGEKLGGVSVLMYWQ